MCVLSGLYDLFTARPMSKYSYYAKSNNVINNITVVSIVAVWNEARLLHMMIMFKILHLDLLMRSSRSLLCKCRWIIADFSFVPTWSN